MDGFHPSGDGDWLIVAGDVAEYFEDVVDTLATLARRFARVIWTPGNHELWTLPGDPCRLRGEDRYRALVDELRTVGITTPEDPFLTWNGDGGPVTVVPLFLLYDYSFLPPGARTVRDALEQAASAGVTCTDEFVLHPDPHPDRAAWCRQRLSSTRARLYALPVERRTLLVGHWPLVREPTDILYHPEFAPWCGTTATADWPRRFNAAAVVYGHLHVPRTMIVDGVPHVEASVGYPREWRDRRPTSIGLRRVFPTGREDDQW